MVDFGTYILRDLNTRKIIPEELFANAYVEEVYETEHLRTDIKQLCVILDAKYKKAYLHKVMETQCQH